MTDLISTSKAAEISGLSQRQIKTLCLQGKIPAQKIGRNYAIPREWAESYAQKQKKVVTVQTAAEIAGMSRQAIYKACERGELLIKDGRIGSCSTMEKHQCGRMTDGARLEKGLCRTPVIITPGIPAAFGIGVARQPRAGRCEKAAVHAVGGISVDELCAVASDTDKFKNSGIVDVGDRSLTDGSLVEIGIKFLDAVFHIDIQNRAAIVRHGAHGRMPSVEGVGIQDSPDVDLTKIAVAVDVARLVPGFRKRGEKKSGKNRNDRNDNQKLDQCKF